MTDCAIAERGVFNEAAAALRGRGTVLSALCSLAFLTLCSYEIARPAAESLFLERYGQAGLPWVWLLLALALLSVVCSSASL